MLGTGKQPRSSTVNLIKQCYRDRKQTLSQNFKRLGLTSKLNNVTGGIEKGQDEPTIPEMGYKRSLLIPAGTAAKELKPQEIQVERDANTGHILRVLRSAGLDEIASSKTNPLNAPLNDISDDFDVPKRPDSEGAVIGALETLAAEEAERLAKTKRPRQQSQREEAWVQALVEKHGQNIPAMARDRKLNVMQQSEGDIRRRVGRYLSRQELG